MTLFNILYTILAIVYGYITLEEEQSSLIRLLAYVLIIVGFFSLLGILATELDMR